MRTLFWLIVLVVLSFAIFYSTDAEAGGPWSDQYCDVETTTIRVVDQNGKVISEYTEEVVHSEDGVKDFLHGMGIASECKFFNWDMPLKNSMVTERSIACKRMDGGHEIVPGYHNID